MLIESDVKKVSNPTIIIQSHGFSIAAYLKYPDIWNMKKILSIQDRYIKTNNDNFLLEGRIKISWGSAIIANIPEEIIDWKKYLPTGIRY